MKYLILFSVLVILATLVCGVIPTSADMKIYNDVVRLHVLANSDSEKDQAVKIRVRDEVLEYISDLVSSAPNAASAEKAISENISNVRAAAERALSDMGKSGECSVSLTSEYYPQKTYDDITLPSGNYASLKIAIGNAEGHNWWCVLYPAICISSAKASSIIKQTGFSPDEIRILTDGDKPTYKLKFKIVELLSGKSS